MRILGFSTEWPKLKKKRFTTFRFERRDKDWGVGEAVLIVLNPRSKEHKPLGAAVIRRKEPRWIYGILPSDPNPPIKEITSREAKADGFESKEAMQYWFWGMHSNRVYREPVNKLTLEWL